MATTQDSVYSYVQGLFQRGTVIVIGSGASCAHGLPGMGALAGHLLAEVPGRLADLPASCGVEWNRIAGELIAMAGLEAALEAGTAPEELVELITELIVGCIQESEKAAIADILADPMVSSFGRLFGHILQAAPLVDVVTTNYDRLVEVHAARAAVRVDSMFYGHTVGRLDATKSLGELYRVQTVVGRSRTVSLTSHPHIRLSKPHGSLDWFSQDDQHYRSDLTVPGARRIIAPGGSKYRLGYEAPFDAHRNRANEAIDKASALFFVGYGFNDEHLQTHLRPRFAQVPAVILSRVLTPNAKDYLSLNSTAIGIEAGTDDNSCRIRRGIDMLELDLPLWELEHLLKEVVGV